MDWDKCLSHQIWPAIEKGWKDEGKNVHFFWGLAGRNINQIREVTEKGEEWWYVDVGYLTQQITRYPEPKIHDLNKTYFRICKGSIHTTKGKVGNGARLRELETKGIDVEFKGWYTGKTEHILLCPSSQTVTFHTNGISQQEWIDMVSEELKKYTERKIVIRNKPRPGNEWWEKDIKKDLENCHCLVTNMSLAAVDAIMNRVPVISAGKNVAAPVSSRLPKYVEKPFKPGRKTINEWLKYITEHQFTIPEIENGVAYEVLKRQYE